jgi:hypothetical protein
MVKEELIQRSPVRIFMNSIHGGLKSGDLGLIASPSGIGKTSVLVQIALDRLLQEEKVIHVSFTQHADYVMAWYEDIFDEFIKKKNLENEQEVKNDIIKNRVLMKFNQEGLTADQILKSLTALIRDGSFKANYIIVDGYRFSETDGERFARVKEFAKELDLAIWYSCTVGSGKAGFDKQNIPQVIKSYQNCFDVIVAMEPRQDHIVLSVSRDRDIINPEQMALRLDPKTLLILEE